MSDEVEVLVAIEDPLELGEGVRPVAVEVEDPESRLLAEKTEHVSGADAVVVGGALAVLEDHDRLVPGDGVEGTSEHVTLGSLDIDLDQGGDVVAGQGGVQR